MRAAILLVALPLLGACPAPRAPTTPATTPAVTAPAPELEPLRRAFPLGAGDQARVLTFAVTDGDAARPDYLLTFATTGSDHGVVLDAGRSTAVLIDAGGVRAEQGFVYLKLPLAVGTAWDTSTGGTPFHIVVEAVGETVTVPAGTYPSCVRTRATGAPGSVTTVYCDRVGPVLFELTSPRGARRMVLRSVEETATIVPAAPAAPAEPSGLE
jgi:hypothetical protein